MNAQVAENNEMKQRRRRMLRRAGKDVSFIIKEISSVEWGENVKTSSRGARWYTYDALFVVTNFHIFKLSWTDVQGRAAHDEIVEMIKKGKITSVLELYAAIGKYVNRYRSPVMLVHSKLEWYK